MTLPISDAEKASCRVLNINPGRLRALRRSYDNLTHAVDQSIAHGDAVVLTRIDLALIAGFRHGELHGNHGAAVLLQDS